MEILVQTRTYDTAGSDANFASAGDRLMVELGDYGSAVSSIEMVAHLRSPSRNPRPRLEQLFDEYHEYLKTLPTVAFNRNLKRLQIEFVSQHFDADDNDRRKPSLEKSHLAALEIAAVLPLLKDHIEPGDDFATDRFLKDANAVLSRRLDSLDQLEAIRQAAHRKQQTINAAKSPWERLGIDWSEYHPQAREILDDPFFWECADDLSPNGNDTGADLLADFREWDRQYGTTSPWRFLEELLAGWEIEPIDWMISDEVEVRQLNKEHPIELSVCNAAAIALAFALLKVRADCPADVTEIATKALARTAILVKDSTLSDETKADWDVAIAKMSAKLESSPC